MHSNLVDDVGCHGGPATQVPRRNDDKQKTENALNCCERSLDIPTSFFLNGRRVVRSNFWFITVGPRPRIYCAIAC